LRGGVALDENELHVSPPCPRAPGWRPHPGVGVAIAFSTSTLTGPRPPWLSDRVGSPLRRLVVAAALFAGLTALPSLASATTRTASDGTTSLPAFQGSAATAHRIRHVRLPPRNPFMARNGDSNVHNDTWMTDAYTRRGPLGRSPSVFSAAFDRDCITLTFDRRGRIVASCISPTTGPRLFMLDPRPLHTLAEHSLPFVP